MQAKHPMPRPNSISEHSRSKSHQLLWPMCDVPAIWTQFIPDHTADTSKYGHMLRRYIESALENLSFAHRKMALVSGPRQCGKTTLGKMLLKDRGNGAYFHWDETEFRRLWTKSPKSVFPSNRAGKSGQIVPLLVLDEIHKAKKWKQTLKGVYDTLDLPADILVTGSASLSIYRKGSGSLMGRYYHFRLHPLTLAEIGLETHDKSAQKYRVSV